MEYKIVKSNSLDDNGKEVVRYYIKKKIIFNIWNYTILQRRNINEFSNLMMLLQVIMIVVIIYMVLIFKIPFISISVGLFIFFTEVIGSQVLKFVCRDVYTEEREAQEVIKNEIRKKKYVAKEETISHIKYKNNNLTVEKHNE